MEFWPSSPWRFEHQLDYRAVRPREDIAQLKQRERKAQEAEKASTWNGIPVGRRHSGVKAHLIDLSYLSLALTFLFSSSTTLAATFTPADASLLVTLSPGPTPAVDMPEVNYPSRKPISYTRNDTSICQNSTNSRLRNISSYYHTPWLDRSFCSFPRDDLSLSEPSIQLSQLPVSSDCRPSDPSVLDKLLFQCDMAPAKRSRQNFQASKLEFCSDYGLEKVLGGYDACVMKGEKEECQQCLRSIYQMDQQVKLVYCHFARDILGRFDCETPFSVKWNCTHCQTAYRQWLCAMLIPFRMDEYLIKPCRTFCTVVEQRCPYLTPDDRVIIAGEPMFLCKDPDIPELYSAYDEPPHCYQPCHLHPGLEPAEACRDHELLKDQLAAYYNMSKHPLSSSSILNLCHFVALLSLFLPVVLVSA
ncbi:hypothetical protein RvY_11116 [Ramazzottius varieornatus]|uniref:FZ domain-containing protein n=1 Tax=Ramazzottius varieornatus TaxID=947166 RepID=A0A1D1VMU9_RAMVA|nr:hypothetical protein RvY_11116 [Ramazzottius varieornatus]